VIILQLLQNSKSPPLPTTDLYACPHVQAAPESPRYAGAHAADVISTKVEILAIHWHMYEYVCTTTTAAPVNNCLMPCHVMPYYTSLHGSSSSY